MKLCLLSVCAWVCGKGTHNMFFWMALHLNFWVRVYLVDLRLANQLSYCLLHIYSVLFRHEHAHTVPYSRPCVCTAALCPLSHRPSSWIKLLGWKLDRNISNCILSSVCIPNTQMLLQWNFVWGFPSLSYIFLILQLTHLGFKTIW